MTLLAAQLKIEDSPEAYEAFLAVSDPRLRRQRGVYYTPSSVVEYILGSLDYLLKTEFGLEDGLAGEIQIVDPAMGTGIFLRQVISRVQETFRLSNVNSDSENSDAEWQHYVTGQLLPRLNGYEVLPEAGRIAEWALRHQLSESGYVFQPGESLNIHLENALEVGLAQIQVGRRLVVVGNPPWAGVSANMAGQHTSPIEAYKQVDGEPLHERKHWLQDDYVKFFRFGQQAIERAGEGILVFVANHGYLDNPTFRGMRRSLMQTFDRLYLLDLHGNVRKQERGPANAPDENIFDIQQGVAIGLFVKKAAIQQTESQIYHANLWGKRAEKYLWLAENTLATTVWEKLAPTASYYLFGPQDTRFKAEYESGWNIADIMPLKTTGVLTAHDHFVIDFEDAPLKERMATFLDPALDDEAVKAQLGLSENYAWRVSEARQQLRSILDWEAGLSEIAYRPFDHRRIVYQRPVVWRTREKVMQHMQRPNIGLVCSRQQSLPGEWRLVGVATGLVESAYLSNKTAEINYVFPLYRYEGDSETRQANLRPEFIAVMVARLGLIFVPDGAGDRQVTFGPEDIFNYIYAVLHAPGYRQRYAEFLKLDFPRLPFPADLSHFQKLCGYGAELVGLHTGKLTTQAVTNFPVSGSNRVEKVLYDGSGGQPRIPTTPDHKGRVWINSTQYFEGISQQVWDFRIGSYQVCRKWLKDRTGRVLTSDQIAQYANIVAALSRTLWLTQEIQDQRSKIEDPKSKVRGV